MVVRHLQGDPAVPPAAGSCGVGVHTQQIATAVVTGCYCGGGGGGQDR